MEARDGARQRGTHQLPPGRHGLSRRFVARNQRERILAAVATCTAEAGYGSTTVRDIIGVAGVSRRTFYELYDNRDDAFLAAFDEGASRLITSVRAAYKQDDTFEARLESGLSAFLTILASSPSFATMCIVEAMAAGPDAVARRTKVMTDFAGVIESHAQVMVEPRPDAALIAEMLVGGIYEAVYRRLARGRAEDLPMLLPDLVHAGLLHFLGEERAAAYRAERVLGTGA